MHRNLESLVADIANCSNDFCDYSGLEYDTEVNGVLLRIVTWRVNIYFTCTKNSFRSLR